MDVAIGLGLGARVRAFAELTRPRVVALVGFTAAPVVLAAPAERLPSCVVAIVGTVGLACACSALNAWVERESDGRMARTASRPLPSGRLAPDEALAFGWLGAVASLAVLLATGLGPFLIGVATLVHYVGVYTIWLKRRSAWNIVIGGAAGATAPLIVDAAVRGAPGPLAWALFALVFAWTPAHFWAIALFRAREYAAAGIPMMPAVAGPRRTRLHMLGWAIVTLVVSLAPVATGALSWTFGIAAAALGGWLVGAVIRAIHAETARADRHVFVVSIVQLTALFAAMGLDLAW